MPRSRTPEQYLLVEGKNDIHVITNLCKRHGITGLPCREPNEDGEASGIDELLAGIPGRLQESHVHTFGIVVDADEDATDRWRSIRAFLLDAGYASIPATPVPEGWISTELVLKRVGVWVMPDNQLSGMLEDFAAQLIPNGDILLGKAEDVLQELERDGLQQYGTTNHAKALIHTWLAWQATPGMPIGLAITAKALDHDTPAARRFVAWVRRLFALPFPAQEVA